MSASSRRCEWGARQRVTDVDDPQIARLPGNCRPRSPRRRAAPSRAGFDGVELHYAHAYTMASFLSASNTRPDGYGGDLESRLKLPLEVHAAVRNAVRPDFVVGCRCLADECIPGGNDERTAQAIGVRFAGAGFDFLSLSRGGKFEDAARPKVGEAAYPYTGRSGYECMPSYYSDARGPFGRNLPATAQVRSAVRAAGTARRWLRPAAFTTSHRPKPCWRPVTPTSSASRARPSPIPTGSARCARGGARKCGCACTRIIARRWTSAIARSPASSGIARPWMSPGSRSRGTAAGGCFRRPGIPDGDRTSAAGRDTARPALSAGDFVGAADLIHDVSRATRHRRVPTQGRYRRLLLPHALPR